LLLLDVVEIIDVLGNGKLLDKLLDEEFKGGIVLLYEEFKGEIVLLYEEFKGGIVLS
jgi:hypothetical protein